MRRFGKTNREGGACEYTMIIGPENKKVRSIVDVQPEPARVQIELKDLQVRVCYDVVGATSPRAYRFASATGCALEFLDKISR
jgi:hypothetical protein